MHRHTTSAAMESVRIPRHSLGLIVETQGDDMAIVEVEGTGKVELRVQDLEHVSLVIDEVDCFKYLGLHLDYALRMEEATEAGVSNIHFAHSKWLPPYIAYDNYQDGATTRHYRLSCACRCGDRVYLH